MDTLDFFLAPIYARNTVATHRRSVMTALVAAVGACLAGLVAPGTAGAAVTCTYDPISRTVTASADGILNEPRRYGVYRSGDQIAATTTGPCGASTVFNTDTVVVRDVSPSGNMGIDSPDIPTNLAPGFTDEPGSSDEIEIVLDYGSGRDGLFLFPAYDGPPGAQFLTAGGGLLNLNAAEADGIDADVTLGGVDFVTIFLNSAYGGTAADEVRGDGGDGTGVAPWAGQLSVSGGPGDDLLVGGTGEDYFGGEEGADSVRGGGGPDRAYGGPGPDRLFGERGRDRLAGEEGNDRHGGGPGRDYCDGGPGRDTFASCESTRG